ncbi:MAG: biotin/lipoyl-containing protein [Myxococcota bacterium]
MDVQVTEGNSVQVSISGRQVEADIQPVPGGVNLIADGKVVDLMVGGPSPDLRVASGGTRASVRVLNERNRRRRRSDSSADGTAKELRAPMPGRVVKVLVAEGEEVVEGQPLVVVEAMKMENELRAQSGGKIARVSVSEGQSVEGGALLVAFA